MISEIHINYYLSSIKNKLNKTNGFGEVVAIIDNMHSEYLTKDIFSLALQKEYCYSENSPEILKSDLDYISMAVESVKNDNQVYGILENVYWSKFRTSELKTIIKKIIDRAIQKNDLTSTLFFIPYEYANEFTDSIEFSSNDFEVLFMWYINKVDIQNMNACLTLISKYHNYKEKNEKLDKSYSSIVEKVTKVLMDYFKCDKGTIDLYITMIKNGASNPLNFIYIEDLDDLYCDIEGIYYRPDNISKYKKMIKKQA